MPLLDALDTPSDPAPFTDTDYTHDMDTTTSYPPAPSLAPFSSLFGYSETNRMHYIALQLKATSRLLGFEFTPTEISAQIYYDSIYYAYESYGDVIGTTSGLLLAIALRNRKPGIISTAVARMLRQRSSRGVHFIALGHRLVIFGALGRLYGLGAAGIQALNRTRNEQKRDPRMARLLAAKAKKISAMENIIREGAFGSRELTKGGAVGDVDEQSLSGMELADQQRRSDEADADAEKRAFPFGRPSEKVTELEQRTPSNSGDDSFFPVEHEGVPQQQRGGWKNTHSSTTESAWERLRRGQCPASSPSCTPSPDNRSSQQSPWPHRTPMKGFSSSADNELGTDSFSFSKTVEERELAKAQAQKEFDESVERERRICMQEGSGGVYSWDGQSSRGR